MKAKWNRQVLADSDSTIVVENNYYFPPSSINSQFFNHSETTSICPWKGKANYYNISVDGEVNQDAAWYYAKPKEDALDIKGYVSFWKGVEIST